MADDDRNLDYADTEYLYNRLMAPALAGALAALGLRPGWRVLDAGCGPGGVLPVLAAGVAPGGDMLYWSDGTGVTATIGGIARFAQSRWRRV